MSKTQTNQFSTETGTGGQGDFGNVKAKDVAYVQEELPDSMLKAIRIIERLLTQVNYHEQQILYQDYPPVDIVRKDNDDDDDSAKNQENMLGLGFGGKEDKKKKEESKDLDVDKDNESQSKWSVEHLFKF